MDIQKFVTELGLPAWTVLVIAGGAIVGALISAIAGVVIAWINSRAAVRLDREKALREHHIDNMQPVREYVKNTSEVVGRHRIVLSRTQNWPDLSKAAIALIQEIDAANNTLGAVHIDGKQAHDAMHLYFKCGRLLIWTPAVMQQEQALRSFQRLEPYFDLTMTGAGIVMDATDAYVFDTRKMRKTASDRLDICQREFNRLKAISPGAAGQPELA